MSVKDLFEKYEDEDCEFERIENKPSNRPDLCAFILIDKLFPKDEDIVYGTGLDEYWINLSKEEIESISPEHIIYLIRCGFYYDSEYETICKHTYG